MGGCPNEFPLYNEHQHKNINVVILCTYSVLDLFFSASLSTFQRCRHRKRKVPVGKTLFAAVD